MTLIIHPTLENQAALQFCEHFLHDTSRPKYVLGTNGIAASIANAVKITGFIDEYTHETQFMEKPILKLTDISENALVVSAVIGKAKTAQQKLQQYPFASLDYFAFYREAGINIEPVRFWEAFQSEFQSHRDHFERIYSRLADAESKKTFSDIINFRLSYDLSWMKDYTDRQNQQYFEPFLELQTAGESFVDVGGYNGDTALEFIHHCPEFDRIHFFEPDAGNIESAKQRLQHYYNIDYYQKGLSDLPQTLRFTSNGSCSRISDQGDIEIQVDLLDNLLKAHPTFIKMDIEGAEHAALRGARKTIIDSHPKLAICVYHQVNDFWQIPELVFSFRDDYKIYLRHYTEGVDETVMFFIPD